MTRPDFRAVASVRLAEDTGHSPAVTNFLTDGPSRMMVRELEIDQIEPHPQRRNRMFDAEEFEQLAHSIRIHGVQEPLLVRPLASNSFQLIAGDRRLRAARSVGLAKVPVVIRELDDETALELVTRGVSRPAARPPQLIGRDAERYGSSREPIVISGADLDLPNRAPIVISGPGADSTDGRTVVGRTRVLPRLRLRGGRVPADGG